MSESVALNVDCMEYMRTLPDKAFDLAVVDPPYGGGFTEGGGCKGWFTRYRQDVNELPAERERERERELEQIRPAVRQIQTSRGQWHGKQKYHGEDKKIISWDVAPGQDYFEELFRVSRNQIIWGGNYFPLPPTRCFLIWRKTNIPINGFSMAPVEYAWTSFQDNAACCEFSSFRGEGAGKFHPTEKPIDLYSWIYSRYAKNSERILDTHLGSGSSRIAAYDAGLDFVGCEIDKTYFDLQEERFAAHSAQGNLFLQEELF